MDTQRLILLVIFSFSILMLWEAWEKEKRPKPAPPAPTAQQSVPAPSQPVQPAPSPSVKAPATVIPGAPAGKGEIVRIDTDLIVAQIDTLGATLHRIELLQHKDSSDPTKNLTLLGVEHHYEAQSGLAGEGGPNHRTLWRALPGERALAPRKDTVEVRFTASGKDGVQVQKVYTFRRNSYVVDVVLEIRNPGAAPLATYSYFQLTHDGKPDANPNTVAETFGAQAFIGFAVYTEERKFEKVHSADLDKGKSDHVKQATSGWLAFVQHYFVAAWLPPRSEERRVGK